jgi:DNA repair protein RadC
MLPREKLLKKGAKALSDLELLSILIGTGTKSEGFKSIARKSLREIKRVVDENRIFILKDIISIKGIGLSKASRIISGIELGKRLYNLDKSEAKLIATSESAAKYAESLGDLKQEQVRVLLLDARYRLIEDRLIAFGKVNSVSVEPREILEAALVVNAVNLVLLHNHPTGDVTPSREDIVFTRRIKESCNLLGLKLLDHLIIAKDRWQAVID